VLTISPGVQHGGRSFSVPWELIASERRCPFRLSGVAQWSRLAVRIDAAGSHPGQSTQYVVKPLYMQRLVCLVAA